MTVPGAEEHGFVAIELVAGLAVLVLPVALLVLALPVWGERQDVARVVAREVGRTIAADGRCLPAVARRLGLTVATNLGVRARDVVVTLDCAPGAELPRGGAVTVAVSVVEPGLPIPGIGSVGGWVFASRHAEPVDRYAGAP